MLINNKKYKLLLLTTFSFIITTTLFQNCSPVKLGIQKLGLLGPNFSEGLSYAPKSVSGAQVITNGNVVLKEYRHKSSNRYFYTSRVNDQSLLDTTFATLFEVTGNTITLKALQEAGFSPVYRLFNKAGFHLYTADPTEQTPLLTNTSWQDEGIEGYAIKINPGTSCPITSVATRPVSRLLHAGNGKYRLVANDTLKDQLLTTQGYIDKGIVFCAVDASTVVVTPPICNAPSCANPPTGYTYSGSTIVNGCVTSCGNLIPIAPSCGSLPTGYTPSVCSSFYRGTGNAQVVSYCDCVGNPTPTPNASCTLGTTTIAHGAPVTAYQAASVVAPATCQSQSQTCNNGVLVAATGTTENFAQASCTVVPSIVVPPAGSVACTNRPTDQEFIFDGNYDTDGIFRPRTFRSPEQQTASYEIIPGAFTVTAGFPARYNMFTWNWVGPAYPTGYRMTISPCRGDFTSKDAILLDGPGYTPKNNIVGIAGSIDLYFDEDITLRAFNGAFSMSLPSNRHWYINVRNDFCSSTEIPCALIAGFKHAQR